MDINLLYASLPAPARRALQALGITEIEELSTYTRAAILGLHGIGPGALTVIETELTALGLAFPDADAGASLVDAYIEGFSGEAQAKLKEIRAIIKSAAPEATGKISYQMPTFYLHGNLVHFAGFKHHIGFYPVPSGIEAFEEELQAYKRGKGSVQFPIGEPLPAELIRQIVRFRVDENTRKKKQD